MNAALSRWENEGGAISDEDAREQQADAAGDGAPDSEPEGMSSTARRRDAGLTATPMGRRHASSHGPGVRRLSCP